MVIRLNDKDLDILKDTGRFNGLSAESIRQVHFAGTTYAWKRLNALYKSGYLERKYYYTLNQTQNGIKHSQRIAAIYYLTPKGLKAISLKIDPRYVVPQDVRLDVHFMISKLYKVLPGLLSKRESMEKYGLKSFMPVTCIYPSTPPVFISILGKDSSPWERSNVLSFFKTKIFPGTYAVISRNFPEEKLLLTDSHFIFWRFAPSIIPKMVQDKEVFLNQFLNVFEGAKVLAYKEPFVKIQAPGYGVLNIAELFSGSTHLMLHLMNPSENTCIYIENLSHLGQGVKLEKGSFYVYTREDERFYEIFIENGKMKAKTIALK